MNIILNIGGNIGIYAGFATVIAIVIFGYITITNGNKPKKKRKIKKKK